MTMSRADREIFARLARALLALAVAGIFAGLAFAVLSLPVDPAGLAEAVGAELAGAGARNPVTAVLPTVRGHDTFLDIAVLLLARMASWTMRRGELRPQRDPGEILTFLASVQAPVMIVVAGYLLWSGGDAPGGAFQAGAILAAAGVLLVLAGSDWPQRLSGWPLRAGLVLGLTVFIAVGVASVLGGRAFLDYSERLVAATILIIEVSATVSIGLALLDMFLSVLRGRASNTETAASMEDP